MHRKSFIRNTALLATATAINPKALFSQSHSFPEVRIKAADRHFQSRSVEEAIKAFQKANVNPELAWLFNNCYPNTLDTTVYHTMVNGKPDTYVITGDIDAMWLRDSSAQVFPYLHFVKNDEPLKMLIAGVINRQTACILKDPYANAFYKDSTRVGEWAKDHTAMQAGVHERKWEIDSLCYPIRLAYHYWKATGDKSPFDAAWLQAIKTTLRTFKEQQRKNGDGPYSFQRTTMNGTDTHTMAGFGYPIKPNGLIVSSFRPSDDATVFGYLIPSNFFAVTSLDQAAEMVSKLYPGNKLAQELNAMATEVNTALKQHSTVMHQTYGKIYSFEINGLGSVNLMDDANVPSLLGMPYLGAMPATDPLYQNTRKFVWSAANPFFYSGTAAKGIGGPHVGKDMIWPMSLIMLALTSTNKTEIKSCINTLQNTHAGTGFMHEAFHKDDPSKFTRTWFAWANTLFGELLWKTWQTSRELLR